MDRDPAVYIMASAFHGTIYTGVTSNLLQRIHKHREATFGGFTADYDCKRLVWFETGGSMEGAIKREKQLKNWRRDWKIALIEAGNPLWRDLAEDFGFEPLIGRKKVGPDQARGDGDGADPGSDSPPNLVMPDLIRHPPSPRKVPPSAVDPKPDRAHDVACRTLGRRQ
jgi:putative endonuclease